MAEIDKVDVFISAATIIRRGDSSAKSTINQILTKALEQDKESNQYSSKVTLNRFEKKMIKGYSL